MVRFFYIILLTFLINKGYGQPLHAEVRYNIKSDSLVASFLYNIGEKGIRFQKYSLENSKLLKLILQDFKSIYDVKNESFGFPIGDVYSQSNIVLDSSTFSDKIQKLISNSELVNFLFLEFKSRKDQIENLKENAPLIVIENFLDGSVDIVIEKNANGLSFSVKNHTPFISYASFIQFSVEERKLYQSNVQIPLSNILSQYYSKVAWKKVKS